MALEEPSEYLQGKWEHELKCFNCKTVMCVTQDDIIDYKFSTKARGNSFGVQCTCCKFPLELTGKLPPIVQQRAWKIVEDLKYTPGSPGSVSEKSVPLERDSEKSVSEKRWSFKDTCKTCRSKIRGFVNHTCRSVTCPACSHFAFELSAFKSVDQPFSKYLIDVLEFPHVEKWIIHNQRSPEVVELSKFVIDDWSVKCKCINCSSVINVTNKSEMELKDDFVLKARCEGCNKLTIVHKFKHQHALYPERTMDTYPPEPTLILGGYLSYSNYDKDKAFPPVIFWKVYDRLYPQKNTGGGCIIS